MGSGTVQAKVIRGRLSAWSQTYEVTACAFSLQHTDPSVLARVLLDTLSALPGVDIGVASAILALSLPDEYGVIDPRIWKEMYGQDKTGFSLSDYTMYLAHLLEGARQLGWIAEELDFFTGKARKIEGQREDFVFGPFLTALDGTSAKHFQRFSGHGTQLARRVGGRASQRLLRKK